MSNKKNNRKKEFKHKHRLNKKLETISPIDSNEELPKCEKTVEELRSNANEAINRLKRLLVYSSISLKTNQVLSDLEKQVIQEETRNIVESIISATEFLINSSQSILQNAILDELKEEIKRLDKWTKRSEDRYLDMLTKFSENRNKEIIWDYREYEESLATQFENEEFNIYSDIETFQYPLPFEIRSRQISTQVIPEYEQRVIELERKRDLIAEEIRKEPIIQRLFPNIRYQKSKVFKEIVDKKGTNG